MSDFSWAEDQIEYTDNVVDEVRKHIDYLGVSLNYHIRSIQSASNRFERLIKEGDKRDDVIKFYKEKIETNRRYLVVLQQLYEEEMSVVALAC
jgi:hypothetical protein